MTRNAEGRKHFHAVRRVAIGVCVLWLGFVENAWAYLDPSTGWMIVQGVLAAIAAAGVAVASCWSTVKGWLGLKGQKQNVEGIEVQESEQK